jgi:Zn-dependent peptidase ImmA (M78 family)
MSDEEIHEVVRDLMSQNPTLTLRDGGPLDPLCRALNVDLEYSDVPNEILLEVPVDKKAVIWLGKNGKPRHDRLAVAIGVGHWILHVPGSIENHPGCGMQALYAPTEKEAQNEAQRFALALLMPQESFKSLWYEGKAQLVAETLNVPTLSVYDRAKMLRLDVDEDHKSDTAGVTVVDPRGILTSKEGAAAEGSAP